MHHVLEIPEILLNIFSHFYPCSSGRGRSSDLLALARTCKAFKEPALDVLWKQLPHLVPVARCLPEASSDDSREHHPHPYWFRRPLTSVEWDILRSYTSRTRSIHLETFQAVELTRKALINLSMPPTIEPLFLNVHSLRLNYANDTKSLILLPFPSLNSLEVQVEDTRFFENFLRSLAKTSPNLTMLSIIGRRGMDRIESSFICRWQNLQIVDCHQIFLDVNTLLHLSRTPSLTRLGFTPGKTLLDQISPSNSPFTFSSLDEFITRSQSLDTVSRLISQTQLPAVKSVSVTVESPPSRQDLFSFFSSVQTSASVQNVWNLRLDSSNYFAYRPEDVLGLQDLAPCMAFGHLRLISLDVEWKVYLMDGELLTLASAWPQLEGLSINKRWGWRTPGGITPDGLLQLLQTCPSLDRFALAIDTRAYANTNNLPSPASQGSAAVRRVASIDVVDSTIERESIPAIAAFLSGIVLSDEYVFTFWGGEMRKYGERYMYSDHWTEVDKACREMVFRTQISEVAMVVDHEGGEMT